MDTSRILWTTATSVLAAIAVTYGFLGARMLLRTHNVVGSISADDREAIQRLLGVSREYRSLIWTRTVLLYVGVGGLIIALLTRDWLWLIVAATPFTLIWWMRVRTTTPPVALLLGTSTHTTIKRQRDVKRRISPLRVISLLDVNVPWDSSLAREVSLDCFRTTVEDDWWPVIAGLMEISPVLVIDAAADTRGVTREGAHILSTTLAQKCLFLTPPDGFAPILNRLLPATRYVRGNLQLATYEEAPDAIAGMVDALSRSRRSRTVAL